MKGVVFSEFIELVEELFSLDLLDEIIMECDLPSGGSYTSVGTYDHNEIVQLVTKLSEKTGTDVSVLLKTFGKHLSKKFSKSFPGFFAEGGDVFGFMKRLDNHIHVEVKKLYPDADLPKFDYDESNEGVLMMEYQSERGFADLAEGLIDGVIEFYGENMGVDREDISGSKHVKFFLKKQ